MNIKSKKIIWIFWGMLVALMFAGCVSQEQQKLTSVYKEQESVADIEDVPEYSGQPYVEINNNEPDFSQEELQEESYEYYESLDSLGRCGMAESCIGQELMPSEKRGSIGQVKPSGWHTVKYEHVDGKYLYNRCHLIGYQLTAENANEKNLITGTRYMNVEGMLPFENMVADYIKETNNHVLYRVNPVYEEDNLVASGVQMEAESVEDHGEGICYNVYVYNVQPGVTIDYATGESQLADEEEEIQEQDSGNSSDNTYILNNNSRKFHQVTCSSVQDMSESNKKEYTGTRNDLVEMGYEPCGRCKP